MPCRCDDMETPQQYRQEADKMAALLCSLCEFLERQHTLITNTVSFNSDGLPIAEVSACNMENWPASVRKWWKDHKKKDAERAAQEAAEQRKKALKLSALEKLTKEERIALGFPSK